jgi:hypothetical protein
MYYRLKFANILFERPARNTKYTMLKHDGRFLNPDRLNLLNSARDRYKSDGLNSLKYELFGIVKYPLFTHILIDVGAPISKVTAKVTTVGTSVSKV